MTSSSATPDKKVLRGATLVDPSKGTEQVADLWIAQGKVAAIGQSPDMAPDMSEGFEEVDARNTWVCPGLIDLCARVLVHTEAELAAARAGGIAQLICPPGPGFTLDSAAQIRERTAPLPASPRVHLLGAMTRRQAGKQLTDQAALQAAGCVGLSDGGNALADSRVLRSAMQYAASLNITLFLQPQDVDLADGCAHDGSIATRLGLPAIPVAAETAGLARIFALTADTGAKVHLTRLSSAAGVQMLERAKSAGLPVTADVAIHQLFLTEHDLIGYNPQCHILPPARSTGDRDALIRAVADGTIDAICSDHSPLSADAKLSPFADTEPGISGIQTLLVLGLRLVENQHLSRLQLLKRMINGPADLLGIACPGIDVGMASSDLVWFDPSISWRPAQSGWHSAGRNTPMMDWEFQGRPVPL